MHQDIGDSITEHERLRETLIKLNPRDCVDWDGSDFKKHFNDPDSSSSW